MSLSLNLVQNLKVDLHWTKNRSIFFFNIEVSLDCAETMEPRNNLFDYMGPHAEWQDQYMVLKIHFDVSLCFPIWRN